MMTCAHEEFITTTRVFTCDSGKKYIAVKLRCNHCGELVNFKGLPNKIDLNGASVSRDSKEVRLAIEMPVTPEVRDWRPVQLFLTQAVGI